MDTSVSAPQPASTSRLCPLVSGENCSPQLWRLARENWPLLTGFITLCLLALVAMAETRFVAKEEYSKDQYRLEKRLDEISSDVKKLLQR